MKRALISLTVVAATAWWLSLPGESCIAIPRENKLSTNPSNNSIKLDRQSAFLWQENGQEHMLLSVVYSGGTSEFAWVIPVESRPKVKVEQGAPFNELRRLTTITRPMVPHSVAGMPSRSVDNSVKVLERREEGPYDLALLSASSSGGLYQWLKNNGFHVSKNARAHLDYYVQKNYIFVAARIRSGAQDNQAIANKLRSGTIAPMHLTFKAQQLTYPLKVTAGNPGPSEMELYVAGSIDAYSSTKNHKFRASGLNQQTFKLTPVAKNGFNISGPPGCLDTGSFPTLRRLIPQGGTLNKFDGVLMDAQRQQDLVFANIAAQRKTSATTVKVGGAVPQVGKTELPTT